MNEFVNTGRRLVASRKFQEAVKVCRLGLLKEPACVPGRLVLAQALMSLARYDEVLAETRAALEVETDSAEATVLMGEALFFKGAYTKARDALRRAAELVPDNEKVRRLLTELDATAEAGLAVDVTGEVDEQTRSYPSEEEDLSAVGDETEIQDAPPVMPEVAASLPGGPVQEITRPTAPSDTIEPPVPPPQPPPNDEDRPDPVAGEVTVSRQALPEVDAPTESVDISQVDHVPPPKAGNEWDQVDEEATVQERPASASRPQPGRPAAPPEDSRPGRRWADRRWLKTEDAHTKEAVLVPSPRITTEEMHNSDLFPHQQMNAEEPTASLRRGEEDGPTEGSDSREAETAFIKPDPNGSGRARVGSAKAAKPTPPKDAKGPWDDEDEETVPRPAVSMSGAPGSAPAPATTPAPRRQGAAGPPPPKRPGAPGPPPPKRPPSPAGLPGPAARPRPAGAKPRIDTPPEFSGVDFEPPPAAPPPGAGVGVKVPPLRPPTPAPKAPAPRAGAPGRPRGPGAAPPAARPMGAPPVAPSLPRFQAPPAPGPAATAPPAAVPQRAAPMAQAPRESSAVAPRPATPIGRTDITARTRRTTLWLRARWRLLAVAGGAVVVVALGILITVAAMKGKESEQVKRLQKTAMRQIERGTFTSLNRADEDLRKVLRRAPSHDAARSLRLFVVATLAAEYGHGLQRAAEMADQAKGRQDEFLAAGRCLLALVAGHRERAKNLAKEAGAKYPESPWVAYARATVAEWMGDPDRALTLIAGVTGKPARQWLLRSRARLLLALGRRSEAEKTLKSLSAEEAKRPWVVLLQLRLRLAQADAEFKLASLDGAIGITADTQGHTSDRQRRWAHLLLAEGYARLGKLTLRRTHMTKALLGEVPTEPALTEELAKALLAQNRPARAVQLARGVSKQFPARLPAVAIQAWAALRLGEPKRALTAVRRIPVGRRSAVVQLVEARALLALKRTNEARKLFQRLRRQHPELIAARLAWARLLIADHRQQDALAELEGILRREPRNVDAIREAARIELSQGKAADAVTRYEAAVRLRPGEAALRAELIGAYLVAGDLKSAENAIDAAVSAFPTDASIQGAKGRYLLASGRLKDAVKALQESLKRKAGQVEVTLSLAGALLELGRVSQAAHVVARAEQLAPAAAGYLRGWLAHLRWKTSKDDPNTAFKELRKASRAKTRQGAHAAMLLLELYGRQGDRKGAEQAYRVLKQRHGARPELRAGLALSLLAADAYNQGARLLRAAIRDSRFSRLPRPLQARIYARLSQAYWQAGNFSAAYRRAQRSLKIWGRCGRGLAMEGVVSYERRQFRTARRRLREAVAADPQLPIAHYYLGMSEYQLGQRRAGRKQLRRYLTLRPKGMLAEDARRGLRR